MEPQKGQTQYYFFMSTWLNSSGFIVITPLVLKSSLTLISDQPVLYSLQNVNFSLKRHLWVFEDEKRKELTKNLR